MGHCLQSNIHIMKVPEGAEEEKGWGGRGLFQEIMKENLLNLEREMSIQILEAQRNPNRLNIKRFSLRHILLNSQNTRAKREF